VVLRFGVAVAGLGAVAVLVAFGPSACLPDLVVAAEAGTGPSCGDGYIDPDAGEQCDPGPPSADSGAATACENCRVVCTVGSQATITDFSTDHCYYEPGPTTDEADSINVCESAGGHVVRFVSDNELTLVSNWAAEAPFWVGIIFQGSTVPPGWFPNEVTVEPGWDIDCPGCFAGGGAIEKGDAAADIGKCVTGGVLADGGGSAWSQSICSQSAAVTPFHRWTVCEREPVGTRTRACGANLCLTVAATQGVKRYVIVPTPMEANDAVIACAGQGGRLVVLGSAEEREQLGYEVGLQLQHALPATAALWIGLSTNLEDGGWGWDEPAAGMSPPWGIGQPSQSGPASRAYVLVEPQQDILDSELARAGNASDAGGETHFPLCEVP
jgi:hypothetical protein